MSYNHVVMKTMLNLVLEVSMKNIPKKSIAIIGGGPAALMFACNIDSNKYSVTIYEKNKFLARKFLVAGDGGFNLTHSESLELLINRYAPNTFLKEALLNFSNIDFIEWLNGIGIPTFIGTSKRVFPIKGIKPIDVFETIMKEIVKNNIDIRTGFEFSGFYKGKPQFLNDGNVVKVDADFYVFALGGASWKKTGSTGSWKEVFESESIKVNEFYPSNCAYKINWSDNILKSIEGKPIKNAAFTCGDSKIKGEAVLTTFGIEGSGIYPLSPFIRKQLIETNKATVLIDFKPEISYHELVQKFELNKHSSIKEFLLKNLKLTELQIVLLKSVTSKSEYQDVFVLSKLIKKFPIEIVDFAPIDESISTVGGIDLNELTEHFELKKMPNTFCIGEMLDYDAPTGGYLLQSCFSMGKFVSDYLNKKDF